jgi:acetyl-CoA synthetase (ADP-forming)
MIMLEELNDEMNDIGDVLDEALTIGQKQLSEYESKKILSRFGIPVVREMLVGDLSEANAAAEKLGYPIVLKACAAEISHKTESGLIGVDLRSEADLSAAFTRIAEKMGTGEGHFLVQEMIKGSRELVMGMTRDPVFGSCVMFGIGGIFAEALGDVSFRAAPLTRQDALEMMQEIRGQRLLSDIRGMAAPDRNILADCLVALGDIGADYGQIKAIDINPMIIRDRIPVAVDALIVLTGT